MSTFGSALAATTALMTDAQTCIEKSAVVYCGTAGGTANAITLTTTPTFTALSDGMCFSFQGLNYSTAAITVNVNSIGAKALVDSAAHPMTGGEIIPNGAYVIMYVTSGDTFKLISRGENGTILKGITTTTISNSTTETDLFSDTVKRRTLYTGRAIKGKTILSITNTSGSTVTYTIKVKLGGSTILTQTLSVPTGTVQAAIHEFMIMNTAAAVQVAYSFVNLNGVVSGTVLGSGAIDNTAADKTLQITGQMSAASASASFVHNATLIEWA